MNDSRVKGLNGIRALCALFILLGHISQRDFCQWEITSLPLPECCAYVFFLISGILAGYRIDQTGDVLSYYRKKARRILPLYYSYVIISVLLFVALGRSDEVLDSRLWYYVFLVPQIPFSSHTGILPLVHLWFIGTIVLFYVLFPLFAILKDNKRVSGAAVIAIACFLVKLALRVISGTDSVLYHLVTVTSMDILFAGVWVGLLMRRGNPVFDYLKGATWLGLIAWLLFLGSGLYARLIPAPIRVEFVAFLAFVIIMTQQSHSPVPNLEIKFLDWMGDISYEIYVVQIIVIVLLSLLYSKAGIDVPAVVIYLVCSAIVIGVAWCFHKTLGKLFKVKHK
jgi:Predicted acyltransferases